MQGEASFLGRGWSFPPSFSAGGAEVAVVSGNDDILQSLQIILATVPGERVMQDAFGCDLPRLLFEEVDQGLIHTIERLVEDALRKQEPRIDVERVEVSQGDAEPGSVSISVGYRIRGTNSRFNLVFPFYLREAAPLGL